MATKAELDHQYRMARWAHVTALARALLRLGMVIAPCMAAVECTKYLSGHITYADIRMRFAAHMFANRWTAMSVLTLWGSGSTSWAVGERRLRQRHIRRVSSEISWLQGQLDPKRRTSHLNSDGTTRPEDE